MQLKEIMLEEFQKELYPHYIELFPFEERKSIAILKKAINDNIMKILKIEEDKKTVGFMIINQTTPNGYIQLDYFGILPDFQSKGYGSKAILELKNQFKNTKGIIIEIEKIEEAKDENDKMIRTKRANFYERLGFEKLQIEVEIFSVIYSLYVLPCQIENREDNTIQTDLENIYEALVGKKLAKEKCKIRKI